MIIIVVLITAMLPLQSCLLNHSDDIVSAIVDSLSYTKILGKYEFIANEFQAVKLHVKKSDTLILIISDYSRPLPGQDLYVGKFSFDKLQRESSGREKYSKSVKGKWQFFNTKNPDGSYSNNLQLNGLKANSLDINFLIKRNSKGNIYIVGYEANEAGAEIYDFKHL